MDSVCEKLGITYSPSTEAVASRQISGYGYLGALIETPEANFATFRKIVLDNFDNLQASWVTQGGKVGQLSLAYGANDMGSVMIEENVVRAAGASYCMDEVEIVRNIEDAGFAAKRRNMHYEILGGPIVWTPGIDGAAPLPAGAVTRTLRIAPMLLAR